MKLSKEIIKKKSKQSNIQKKVIETAISIGMGIINSKTKRIIFTVIIVFILLLLMIGMIGVINFIFP